MPRGIEHGKGLCSVQNVWPLHVQGKAIPIYGGKAFPGHFGLAHYWK